VELCLFGFHRPFVARLMNRASSTSSDLPSPEHDPYAALRIRDFRLYLTGMFLSNVGLHMQTLAVFREVYERSDRSRYAIGLVGLVQVLPVVLLALLAGHVADRLNRKYVVMAALVAIAAASAGLAIVSLLQAPIGLMYGCLFISGVARAFLQPARAALLPQLVSREKLTNALTWATTGFQLAAVIGPAIGGLLIGWFHGEHFRFSLVYLYDATAAIAFCSLVALIRYKRGPVEHHPMTVHNLAAGITFVLKNKVVLGAICMDMFAVLFGGAVALLPIYADEILHIGATGQGWLQAAPAIGALLMSFVQSHRPPLKQAGRAFFLAVATFGVATIIFGLSRSFPLSWIMLFITGAADNISVVVRHSLVQLLTPDAMRGRVSAINGMFISISNELGGFESGMVAGLTSPMFAVVSGGIGTLLVVAAAAWFVPQLRRFGRLDGSEVVEPAPITVP
jgi:MFS family permease